MPPRRSSSNKPAAKSPSGGRASASPSKARVSGVASASNAASPAVARPSGAVTAPSSVRPTAFLPPSSAASTARPSAANAPTARPSKEEPKYAPPQPSFLAEMLWFPFYDHFVTYYPKRWTPNGITLFGIFSTLLASAILLSAMPTHLSEFGAPLANQYVAEGDSFTIGAAFLSKSGVNIDTQNEKAAFYVNAVGHHVAGIKAAQKTQTGVYGKPIAIVPEAIARVAKETIAIVSGTPVEAEQKPAKGLLGLANAYDFHRPQLFYQTLQNPLARVELAFAIVYESLVGCAFNVIGKVAGPSVASELRGCLSEYVEFPIATGVRCLTRKATGLADCCSCFFKKFVPAALLEAPGRWMLIVAGILNLIYCVADNTDGRHARRTKQSSFVGEYLDHGLDCVTSLLTTYLLASALGLEGSQAMVALMVVATVTVLSHLVNQEKGFLIWGNRAFTVDEAMLAFGFGMIAVGVCPSWVSGAVPVELLASVGVPTQSLPGALVHARVGEFLWFGFLASQVSVFFTLINVDRTVMFRPSSLALIANVGIIWYLANTVAQPTALRSGALRDVLGSAEATDNASSAGCALCAFLHGIVSFIFGFVPAQIMSIIQSVDTALNIIFAFEAQLVILSAATCSVIIHAPVFAKCYKVQFGTDNKAFLITLPLALFVFFFVSSSFGAAIAVVGHTIQILNNVCKLNERGASQQKKQ